MSINSIWSWRLHFAHGDNGCTVQVSRKRKTIFLLKTLLTITNFVWSTEGCWKESKLLTGNLSVLQKQGYYQNKPKAWNMALEIEEQCKLLSKLEHT